MALGDRLQTHSSFSPPSSSLGIWLHVFHVEGGLGNACILEFPNHSLWVVDWGTQRKEPFEALAGLAMSRGIRFIAATHSHVDHTLSLKNLLEFCVAKGIQIERFVYPASNMRPRGKDYLRLARISTKDLRNF